MHARRKYPVYSFTRHHCIEEWPDSVVGSDNCFDAGTEIVRRAGLNDVEFCVVRAVQQQAMSFNEVGQEFVCGNAGRRGIYDTSLGAGMGDERVHLFALRVCGSVGRAFGCQPDADSLCDPPHVEQHTA
jgi:hypothetical protein